MPIALGCHTYFIGKDGKYVLVHNDCPTPPLEGEILPGNNRDPGGKLQIARMTEEHLQDHRDRVKGGLWASAKLAGNMALDYATGRAFEVGGAALAGFAWLRKGKNAGKAAGEAAEQLGKHADDAKPTFRHGGGKNAQHKNIDAKQSWREKWEEAKRQLNEAKRNGATKKEKREIQTDIDHFKRKMDETGENHSQRQKGPDKINVRK